MGKASIHKASSRVMQPRSEPTIRSRYAMHGGNGEVSRETNGPAGIKPGHPRPLLTDWLGSLFIILALCAGCLVV